MARPVCHREPGAIARSWVLSLSRRQSATMAGALTDQARVCLAVPLPASTTLIGYADKNKPRTQRRRDESLGRVAFLSGSNFGAALPEKLIHPIWARATQPKPSIVVANRKSARSDTHLIAENYLTDQKSHEINVRPKRFGFIALRE